MGETPRDYDKKIQDLNYVRNQMIKLGNMLTDIDSQHRKIVLEPKFQEKVEKLVQEANLLNKQSPRNTGRDRDPGRTTTFTYVSDPITNARPGPSQAVDPRPGKNNRSIGIDARNNTRSIGVDAKNNTRTIGVDARKNTRSIAVDASRSRITRSIGVDAKKNTRTIGLDARKDTRTIGVEAQFTSEDSFEEVFSPSFGSSASDEFPPFERGKTKSNYNVYRREHLDYKFDEHHRRLERIERNFDSLLQKLLELNNSRFQDSRPVKYHARKRRKTLAEEIRVWKSRANRICDIMGLRDEDIDDYLPEANSKSRDELNFWKYRATELFDLLVKFKRADIDVWKAAKKFIDFDEALDILIKSKRKHRDKFYN